MDKSPDAFRTISEVADWLGTPTHVLRFWESRFSQVKPVKRAGGRRYYRPSDMALLGGIKKLLHEDGLTIRGVQKILREEGLKHVAAMSPPLDGLADVSASEPAIPEPAREPDNVVKLPPVSEAAAPPAPAETKPEGEQAQSAAAPQPAQPSDSDPKPAPQSEPDPSALPDTPKSSVAEPESPSDAHMPTFLLNGMTGAPDAAVGNDTPEPDMTPTRAEKILAHLRAGASADPAALRPLHDRLADLRQRMNAPVSR